MHRHSVPLRLVVELDMTSMEKHHTTGIVSFVDRIVMLKEKEGFVSVQCKCETCKSVNWSHMSHVLIPLFSTCTERRQLSCNVVKVKLLGQYGTCMLK